jgi:hypothetical protein
MVHPKLLQGVSSITLKSVGAVDVNPAVDASMLMIMIAASIHALAAIGALNAVPPFFVLICVVGYALIRNSLRRIPIATGVQYESFQRVVKLYAFLWLLTYVAHVIAEAAHVSGPWSKRQTFLALLTAVMFSDISALSLGQLRRDARGKQ